MDTPRRYECSDVARMAYGACTNDLRPTRRACEKGRFPGVGKGLMLLTVGSSTACHDTNTHATHDAACVSHSRAVSRATSAPRARTARTHGETHSQHRNEYSLSRNALVVRTYFVRCFTLLYTRLSSSYTSLNSRKVFHGRSWTAINGSCTAFAPLTESD